MRRVERLAEGAILENELLRVEIGDDGTLHRIVDRAAAIARSWPIAATSSGPSSTNRAPTTPGTSRRSTRRGRGDRRRRAIEVVETGPLRGAVRVRRALARLPDRADLPACWPARGGWTSPPASTGTSGRSTCKRASRSPCTATRQRTRRCTASCAAQPTATRPGTPPASRSAATASPTLRTGLRRRAPQRRQIRPLRARQHARRSACYAARSTPIPARTKAPRLHLQPLPPSGRLDRGECRRRSVRAQLAADRVPARGRRNPEAIVDFLAVDGLPLALGSLKRAEDGEGLILRLYEPHGNRGRATLRFPLPCSASSGSICSKSPSADPSPVLSPMTARPSSLDCARPLEVVSLRHRTRRATTALGELVDREFLAHRKLTLAGDSSMPLPRSIAREPPGDVACPAVWPAPAWVRCRHPHRTKVTASSTAPPSMSSGEVIVTSSP